VAFLFGEVGWVDEFAGSTIRCPVNIGLDARRAVPERSAGMAGSPRGETDTFPPPPPNKNATLAVAFLFGEVGWVDEFAGSKTSASFSEG
jgi:hypothetical protein